MFLPPDAFHLECPQRLHLGFHALLGAPGMVMTDRKGIASPGKGGAVAFGETGTQVFVIAEQGCQVASGVEKEAPAGIEGNIGVMSLSPRIFSCPILSQTVLGTWPAPTVPWASGPYSAEMPRRSSTIHPTQIRLLAPRKVCRNTPASSCLKCLRQLRKMDSSAPVEYGK